MPVRVLIADDSDVMRSAIRKTLYDESNIEVVGEASSFAATVQMIANSKPDVLLLDLHMAEKREFTPDVVRMQLCCVHRTIAVSFSNDAEAQALAASYGAEVLLDKMNLFVRLIPAILQPHPETTRHGQSNAAFAG